MLTLNNLRDLFKADREGTRNYLNTLRTDIRILENVKEETGRPDATAREFIKLVGCSRALEAISTLIRRHGWDGRIDPRNVKALDFGGLAEDAAVEYGVYTRLHMAHLDQIADQFRTMTAAELEQLEAEHDAYLEQLQKEASPKCEPEQPEQAPVVSAPQTEPERDAVQKPAEDAQKPAERPEPLQVKNAPAGARNRQEKRSSGLYNAKVLQKFRDALQQARADYAANPDRFHVSISNGNSKMGAVASVSLLPFLTCPGCCAGTCGAKCYAAKLANLRPAVLRAYAMNTAIWQADPNKYFAEVRQAMTGVRFFRFHVSGDIPGADYFRRMLEACEACPHCEVLVFTKAFQIVNAHLTALAACFGPNAAKLPGSLHLLFSGWTNLQPDNPYQLPETNVIERGAEPADSWKVCGGNCFTCACRGVGCWQAEAGDTIAFPIH